MRGIAVRGDPQDTDRTCRRGRGCCSAAGSVLMRLFSSSSASASDCVAVVSMRAMRATICAMRGLCCVLLKYDETRFFRSPGLADIEHGIACRRSSGRRPGRLGSRDRKGLKSGVLTACRVGAPACSLTSSPMAPGPKRWIDRARRRARWRIARRLEARRAVRRRGRDDCRPGPCRSRRPTRPPPGPTMPPTTVAASMVRSSEKIRPSKPSRLRRIVLEPLARKARGLADRPAG